MQKNKMIVEAIKKQRVLPLFYHNDPEVCVEVIRTLYQAGARVIEFTNRGSNALANFSELVAERDGSMPDMLLGIGTISNAQQAGQFIEAGADLLISPFFDAGIAELVHQHGILWIPGCTTPTEVHNAESAGFNFLKLFPGSMGGPSLVAAHRPLFPDVEFIVTGGVELSEENITAWLKAGASAVGLGGKLITREILENRQYDLLLTNAQKVFAGDGASDL